MIHTKRGVLGNRFHQQFQTAGSQPVIVAHTYHIIPGAILQATVPIIYDIYRAVILFVPIIPDPHIGKERQNYRMQIFRRTVVHNHQFPVRHRLSQNALDGFGQERTLIGRYGYCEFHRSAFISSPFLIKI